MYIQWTAIAIALALGIIAFFAGCSSAQHRAEVACIAADVAPIIPRIVAAIEAKDTAALAAIIEEVGRDAAVCALKTHAAGQASGNPQDGGVK